MLVQYLHLYLKEQFLPLRSGMKKCFVAGVASALKAICALALVGTVPLNVAGQSDLPVPPLIRFSGILKDSLGQPVSGVRGVMFALYQDQYGGGPVWIETQNVMADDQGRYTVLLGSTQPEGLPLELFVSGQARWLGIRLNEPDQMEQPRVALLSVPYTLKAADAETLSGKPLSAFVLAPEVNSTAESISASTTNSSASGYGKSGLSAEQVNGTAILANPSSTQSINAPSKAGVIPLQVRGNLLGNSNILEIYDAQTPSISQSYFTSQGAFVTRRSPTFSTTTTGSVLFAGTSGLLSQDSANFFWNDTGKYLTVGAASSTFPAGPIKNLFSANASNSFAYVNPSAAYSLFAALRDTGTGSKNVQMTILEDSHSSGTRRVAGGTGITVYHTGAGPTGSMKGILFTAEHYGTGTVGSIYGSEGGFFIGNYDPGSDFGNVITARTYYSNYDVSGTNTVTNTIGLHLDTPTKSGTPTIANNYGIKIEDQGGFASNNWAIKTGTGKVQFGDTLHAEKSFFAGLVTVPFSRTPNFDASQGNAFQIILIGNVISGTLSNAQAGQHITVLICQDRIGNWTFAWPTNMRGGGRIDSAPNTCSAQTFLYDGSNAYALSDMKPGM